MEDLKGVYYFIKDGLKDAWKHYDYAKKAHENKHMAIFKYHVDEGLHRIERMKVADRLFQQSLSEMKIEHKDMELVNAMYDDIIEDAEYLERCLMKLKSKAM